MRSKHSPGPWKYSLSEYANHRITNLSGQLFIAEIDRLDADEQTEANAKLIAAAPDLLRALENLVDEFGSDDPGYLSRHQKDRLNYARAIIKKAIK
jgi:ABC-type multidrug transport system fused ATPase/permease subunit